jgi:hypothetical protein
MKERQPTQRRAAFTTMLSDDERAIVSRFADLWDCSEGAAVRRLIRNAHRLNAGVLLGNAPVAEEAAK